LLAIFYTYLKLSDSSFYPWDTNAMHRRNSQAFPK
jgi:hypothetical protein